MRERQPLENPPLFPSLDESGVAAVGGVCCKISGNSLGNAMFETKFLTGAPCLSERPLVKKRKH
jgi:hypothetical protein